MRVPVVASVGAYVASTLQVSSALGLLVELHEVDRLFLRFSRVSNAAM